MPRLFPEIGTERGKFDFDRLKLAIGKAADPYSDYFDRCRRKRNVIDYDDALSPPRPKR